MIHIVRMSREEIAAAAAIDRYVRIRGEKPSEVKLVWVDKQTGHLVAEVELEQEEVSSG